VSQKNPASPNREKSAYELLREANIARNHKRLADLGLEKPMLQNSRKTKSCGSSIHKETVSKEENIRSSPASVSGSENSEDEGNLDSENQDTETDECSEEIEKILGYKCTSKGKQKLRILWSTGKKEWADYKNVEEDCATLVADFMKNNDNQEIHKKMSVQTNSLATPKNCEHETYNIGVTYIPEDQLGYFHENNELHGVNCSLCFKIFVHTDPIPEKEIKPSKKRPMYTCSNRATMLKCIHSICYSCIMEKMQNQEAGIGLRPSRVRRNVEKT